MNGNINILMNFINHHPDNKGKFLVFDSRISYPDQQKSFRYKDQDKFVKDLCYIIYVIGENKGKDDLKENIKNVLISY